MVHNAHTARYFGETHKARRKYLSGSRLFLIHPAPTKSLLILALLYTDWGTASLPHFTAHEGLSFVGIPTLAFGACDILSNAPLNLQRVAAWGISH